MKKIFILLMTVMGTVQLQAQDQNFWIFLCFGQSNMAGQAPQCECATTMISSTPNS